MAFRGRGRASSSYRSESYAATSAQYNNYPPPPEHNITRHPSCTLAVIPEDWLHNLKHSWNLFKASDHVNQIICGYYSNCENPYASALQIMAESNDFYHSKAKSMASFVIECFSKWITQHEADYRHCLDKPLKMEAFNLVTQQKNIALSKLVFQSFHLIDNPTDYLERIQFMAKCKMYKEACQCATILHLNGHFTLEDLVLPLVLQDKHPIAEEALEQVPQMQKDLVAILDDLLGGRTLSVQIDKLIMKLDVPDVKYEVFYNPKPLGKLIARLIKKFQLNQDLAPNLNKKRTGGALQFLIRKRYRDNLNSASWNEMVIEAVGNDPQLQMELVMTVHHHDTHEALYWAHYFKIPRDQWPYNVKILDRDDPKAKYCQPKTEEEDDSAEENWGNEDTPFHQLSMPDSSFFIVNTVDAITAVVDYFRDRDVRIAGIDSEWKPAFGGKQSELALVQIATNERIFMLDIVNLAGQGFSAWNNLGNWVFRNKYVLKLGFDVGNDLQMIKSALPALGQIKQNDHSYLDLAVVWKRLTNNHKLILPYRDASKDSSSESLSQLVFLTLGRALNKANQFSNWEQRPLRLGQLRYAALDAFCLLEVYQVLQSCCDEQNIPFLEICDEIMLNYKGPRKSAGNSATKKKARDALEGGCTEPVELPWPELEAAPAGQRPLVLPADLRGVALSLRAMGVDTEILECAAGDIVDRARDAVFAGRRIACRGRNYRQLVTLIRPGYCYNVKAARPSDQVAEILKAFNIVVSTNDIFSRCQACNSNKFLKLARDTAQKLHRKAIDSGTSCEVPVTDQVNCAGGTEGVSDKRSWLLIEEPPQIINKGLTSQGVVIQIQQVPKEVLDHQEHLYVCDMCGKCFWDGSHLKRFVNSPRCAAALRRGESTGTP